MSPRPTLRTGALAVGALTLAACATLTIRSGRLSEQLKFSHAKHKGEAACNDCHADVDKSTGPTKGQYIAKKDHGGCASCHDDEVKEKCAFCHLGKEQKIELTRLDRQLKFSHASHGEAVVKGGCVACHPGGETARAPGAKLVPDMKGCLQSCHKKEMAETRCDTCHRNLQQYPVAPVARLSHDGNWLKKHGGLSRNAQRCAVCHDQTYCADCHAKSAAMPIAVQFPEKVDSRFIHRGDFLGRHAVEARAEPASCRKCHGASQCSSCHEASGIAAPAVATNKTTPQKVHPADFMTPGSSGFHGRKARRDISTCASCHDRGAASNCVECHKVGAAGGNPHPVNFKWSDKQNACRTNSMCATCHAGGTGCP